LALLSGNEATFIPYSDLKKMNKKVVFLLSLTLFSVVTIPSNKVFAQNNFGAGINFSNFHQNRVNYEVIRNQNKKPASRGQSQSNISPELRSSSSSGTVSNFRTTFASSDVRTHANAVNLIARSRAAGDLEGAKALEELFALPNLKASMAQAIAPYGLKANDVADAITTYHVLAWNSANNVTKPPTKIQVQAVRRQMLGILKSTPSFVNSTNAQKQEIAETFLIQGFIIYAATIEARKQGPDVLARTTSTVALRAKQLTGIDFQTLQLTDDGLRLN
jgi:hypothetical protein